MQSLRSKRRVSVYEKTKNSKRKFVKASNSIACEAKSKLSKGMRRLKVYYKLGIAGNVPVILLQGEWIRNLGFNVQDQIIVSGELGRLEVRLEE